MALQTLNTIKQWFRTGLKPTQAQFWDTWDSFRHKFEKIPVKDIDGIDELLLSKADKTVLENHLADKNAHAPQVNTDWNSESGFSQLLNKPEFRTVNGQTIVGTGDIAITTEPADLQSVLDTNPIAKYGNSSAAIMGNYGDSKYNNLIVGNDTDRSSMLQLTNQVGFQYSKVGINTESNITVSESGVNIKRSLNGKTTDIVLEDPTVNTLLKIPAKSKEGNTYTIATTDDFKTINGESIVGEGNLDIEPQGLKSVLDADPTASYGESKATLMGDYGTSKFNEIIVSDETEKTGIYQLKNQLSFDHTVLDSNDIGNITLSQGNVILTRDKSNNQTVVDISDPVANTQLRFPAKSEEGKTYTIATTEDFKTINGESIVGSGDIYVSGGAGDIPTLQQVLDKDRNATNASINLLSEEGESQTTVHEGGLNISEKTGTGFLITDINKLGVSVSKDEETTFVNVLADELSLNKNLAGNSVKQGIVLNEDSAGASTIKLPLTSDGDVKTLATTKDFKTINGESIVGEGDITIEGGTTPDATTAEKGIVKLTGDLGGTADAPTTPTAVHKTGNESILGLKSINNSLSNSARFTFNTFNDATNSTLDATTTSSTIPAMTIRANTSNSTGLLVSAFNSNYIGVKIEPTQNSPQVGKMLVLSNAKAVNNVVDIATPLTVLRDGATVSSISDLGNITGNSFVKTGGLPTQFLKADGSIDSNVYSIDSNVIHKTGAESKDGRLNVSATGGFETLSGTSDIGTGVAGRATGVSGIGVAGISSGGTGVQAVSVSSAGLYASTSTGNQIAQFYGANRQKSYILASNGALGLVGGTASQFLKADGSVDSNVYTNDANVIHKTGDESKSGFLTLNTGLKLDSSFISWLGSPAKPTGSGAATITAIGNDIAIASGSSSRQFAMFKTSLLSTAQTYSFPNNSGVIALLSDIPTAAEAGTSGSYTATVSEITNVSINGIGRMSNYIKVGNIVSVQANVNLNITASSTLSRFRISLPINIAGSATNFYCGQGIVFTTTAGTAAYPCQVYLNGGTEAIVQFNSEIGTGPRDVSFNFQYDITKSN
ncbi:hypothetical protein B0A67_10270 [Flavobacterium aquidurense]|jgi:hypothetical protein|uniref:beta strand repeat-containing protein n=1 Tax=Flavobacterium aquidurense TaxID=362413 RepID=UPI0009214B7D|nr:hypothetical protein [Flavobacterium aquidurense]OXA71731.1 hypothetical protein B0A67_10270 [Flavobacterium aquidurense]SHH20791.1 hypothetical protein SAMN05444481_11353 [Flavobacterium frigidimaris]